MTPAGEEKIVHQITHNAYTDDTTVEKCSWYLDEQGKRIDVILKPLPKDTNWNLGEINSDLVLALFGATVDRAQILLMVK